MTLGKTLNLSELQLPWFINEDCNVHGVSSVCIVLGRVEFWIDPHSPGNSSSHHDNDNVTMTIVYYIDIDIDNCNVDDYIDN